MKDSVKWAEEWKGQRDEAEQGLKVPVKDTTVPQSKSRPKSSARETGIPAGWGPGHGAAVITRLMRF